MEKQYSRRHALGMIGRGLVATTLASGLVVVGGCDSHNYDIPKVEISDEERVLYGPKKSIALIIDTSGTMDEKVEGIRKLDSAKKSGRTLVDLFYGDKNMRFNNMGLYDLEGISKVVQVVPIDIIDREKLIKGINSLEIHNLTPIGDAFRRAKMDLDLTKAGNEYIILLTDGNSNAGNDPFKQLKVIRARDIEYGNKKTKVFVIPYDMKSKVYEELTKLDVEILPANNEAQLVGEVTEVGKRIAAEKE